MANASKDDNGVSTLICVLNTTGKSIVRISVDPTSRFLYTSDGTTGSDHGPTVAMHDENSVPTLVGVSSTDFKTPVVAYGDSSGNLLIKSM